ncbi:hypothetical protein [Leptotrichia sp. oral taxon 847]|uniref:hypothetical protein n=1 Tax=Leptotrichia sp. oral taxon 847 TaxID=1785996 RepID=UPI000767FFE7|nr:hypothetical protein [Leptotrichia sp. oral taxon 847]AMD95914.1 hypothetical protein AXF11_10220 [Leptotrichia sp. oral taxon 847]
MNDVVERYESSFNYEEFEVNNEEKEYFIEKEQELINLGQQVVKATLEIGKKLSEVQEKIGNPNNGMFLKWFEHIGFKKNYVYREINRWKMFEKYQISAIAEASIRTIDFIKKNEDKVAKNEIEEILKMPGQASNKIKSLKENIEIKKESIITPEIEIKIINEKIDFYFEKINKLDLRKKELEERIKNN